MRTFLIAGFVFVAAGICASASTINMDLSFTDPNGGGTVLLDASTGSSAGQYLVTSASGTVDGLNIVAFLAPGTYPSPTIDVPNDNLLSFPLTATNSTYFDSNGISFVLFGGEYFNLYASGANYFDVSGGTPMDVGSPVALTSLSVTQTPEPSSSALLAAALLLCGTRVLRRKFNNRGR